MTTKTNIEAVNSGQTEREAMLKAASALEDEYMAVAQGAKKPSRIALEPMVKAVQELRKAAEARDASPAPASPSGEDAAEQADAPMAEDTAEPEHSAIYISKRLTGSDKDAPFVQAHINQAVSEAMEKAAETCESVAAQSKNSLFRSGAKICAGEIRNPTQQCDRPPEGWQCSRVAGHDGPCAASQVPLPRASEQADEAVTRLRRALYQIAHWPDGGNAYGQEKIKNFAIRILDGDPVEVKHAKDLPK